MHPNHPHPQIAKAGVVLCCVLQVRMLVSQFDCDHDGCVELTEWLAALIDWTVAQQHPHWMTWVQQVGVPQCCRFV
jgi:hypothetical protein